MKIKKYFHVLALLIIQSASAQSSSTLMGGRAAGMGYTSVILEDEWALFNNTAGLVHVDKTSTAFAYEVTPALAGANRIAASVIAPSKLGALGVGIFRFGDDLYNEHLLSVGVANQVGNTALGLKLNYVQYRAESFGTSRGVSVDFGGITRITPQISVGARITNLTQSKLYGTDADRLPSKLTVGLGFRPSEKIIIATEIEKDLDYQPTWRSGIEYGIYKKVFFRTGFNLNPDAAYFGLGAQRKNLKFDYAMRVNLLVGASHQASAIYQIPVRKKK